MCSATDSPRRGGPEGAEALRWPVSWVSPPRAQPAAQAVGCFQASWMPLMRPGPFACHAVCPGQPGMTATLAVGLCIRLHGLHRWHLFGCTPAAMTSHRREPARPASCQPAVDVLGWHSPAGTTAALAVRTCTHIHSFHASCWRPRQRHHTPASHSGQAPASRIGSTWRGAGGSTGGEVAVLLTLLLEPGHSAGSLLAPTAGQLGALIRLGRWQATSI